MTNARTNIPFVVHVKGNASTTSTETAEFSRCQHGQVVYNMPSSSPKPMNKITQEKNYKYAKYIQKYFDSLGYLGLHLGAQKYLCKIWVLKQNQLRTTG